MLCKTLRSPLDLAAAAFCLSSIIFGQQSDPTASNMSVPLQVDSGTPLRLYITKRVWYKKGEIVQAKFAESVWAFDRIVIPAQTVATGEIEDLQPMPKMVRAMSIVRGDFTPLKRAQVRFTMVILPDGHKLPIDTESSLGLSSIYVPPRAKKTSGTPAQLTRPKNTKTKPSTERGPKSEWLHSFIKQQATQSAQAQANVRTKGLFEFVRTPNKREWIENYLWAQLPYHPQFYRSGTRFDSVLKKQLDFGEVAIASKELQKISTLPPLDSSALVRPLSTISSADAQVGDPIAGVLSQPVFSADHQLILPEGSYLTGKVTLVRRARMFHRGGQLRFTFNHLEVPATAGVPATRAQVTQAQLAAAESSEGPANVDPEGTAKATESKARFLRPVIAGLVAAKSMDNDTGKQTASGGANSNYSGRTLGGFSGVGLFGALVAQGPPAIGTALGFYGLSWSVYNTIVSRGRNVVFEKNAAMAIRFGPSARRR